MTSDAKIHDNLPLYKIKKYKYALELINDNVPLNIVKRRLHAQFAIELANKSLINEIKKINRKCAIIDAELKKRICKVIIIDPNSDKLCEKCEYNSDYHPYGCKRA